MAPATLKNFACGDWKEGAGPLTEIHSAVTGEAVAQTSAAGLDFKAMLDHARSTGGPALRAMTFHQRAALLKGLVGALNERIDELYALNPHTGATRKDGAIDIEGGIGTMAAIASKGKRELPNGRVLMDGDVEQISRKGTFLGQHVYTPLTGVAIHINAFNFPVWGMLEKLAPTLLAGMPAIVKPATATAYLAEAAFRIMIESGHLPDGAVQLIVGSTGDLLDHLTGQDAVSFTGSAATAGRLKAHPRVITEGVRFIAEQDSVNASLLGPDAGPQTPEFELFVKEVVREMTVKAGQKCTAIRRAFVPRAHIDAVEAALIERLQKTAVGDPTRDDVRMGALVSLAQRDDVRQKVSALQKDARLVFGDPNGLDAIGADATRGAFITPILLRCDDPHGADVVHRVEAFGPVATLMPYSDLEDAIALANRGEGSLVLSLFSHGPAIARDVVLGAGAHHGR
ncbi:MAG: phenylacetic acid degradation bifunctional protein PaaZ, partial [Pseudomonadota bacterium]